MKYIGTYSNDADIATKAKVDAKQDKVLANGILQGDGQGAISAAETQEVELVTLTKADVGLGNVDNTSDLSKPISTATQTALNGKQATITGGASTITSSNLTVNRALVSNASGKVAVSAVTATELGYLDGVTSNIQTQLNNKQAKITASGLLKGNGSGGVTAAVAGTDYLKTAPVTSVNNKTGAVKLVASDVDAVGLTGDQTITGEKTFAGSVNFAKEETSVNFDGGIQARGAAFYNEIDFSNATVTGLSGLLPTVATADNGKFLRVVNGAWAAATVENANGVSF